MAYSLYLAYSEELLESVAAAQALVARDSVLAPRGHLEGRYRSFQAGMVDHCPDLSEDDPGANRPDNAWPLGLPAAFPSAVYRFTPNVSMLEQGLLGLIAESVALHGLHMLDPQAGRVYRPDRIVIDRAGQRSAPPPMQLPAIARSALIRADQTDDVLQPLRDALGLSLRAHGFADRDGGRHGWIRLRGRIGQNLQLSAWHSHGGITLSGRFALYAPEVSALWIPPIASEFERYFGLYARSLGGRVDGWWVCADDLSGDAQDRYGRYRFAHARTREPVARWFEAYGEDLVTRQLPALDKIDSPRALAGLLLGERLRWRLETKNDLTLVEIFGLLVLVHAYARADAQAWIAAFRRVNRLSPGMQGWDDPHALIDRLVAYLQSPAFDPTSLDRG